MPIGFFLLIRGLVLFALQAVIAAKFGAGVETDSYFVVIGFGFVVTDFLVGVLTFSVLPRLIQLRRDAGADHAWKTESTVVISMAAGLAFLGSIAFAAADVLVGLLAPGFGPVASTDTSELLRFSLPGFALYILALVIGVMLQSRELFQTTALVPLLPIIGGLVGVLILPQSVGVYSVLGGFTVGSALALAVQLIAWRNVSRAQTHVFVHLSSLRHLGSNMAVVTTAFACSFLLPVLLRLHASDLGQGTVAAFGFANQILALPIALLITPLGTVFLSRVSRTIGEGYFGAGLPLLRLALTISVLASALTSAIAVALAEPMVALLFERGNFTAHDTSTTAEALKFLGLGLVGVTMSSILARVLSAGGEATSFAFAWVATLLAFALSATVLMPAGGVSALASLYSAAYVALAVLLLSVTARRIRAEPQVDALVPWLSMVTLRAGTSALAAGLASWSAYNVLFAGPASASQHGFPELLQVAASAGIGFVVFAGGILLLKGGEAQPLRELVRSAFGRRERP